MKKQKLVIGIILSLIILSISFIQFNGFVYAEEKRSFEVTLRKADTSVSTLEPGDEFEIIARLDKLTNIKEGLIVLLGQLEFDGNVLEKLTISTESGWNLEDEKGNIAFNEKNLKFIIDRSANMTEGQDIFKIKFKVKDNITENKTISIKVKGISASGGTGLIYAKDAETTVNIKPAEKEEITSKKYNVDNSKKVISKITPDSTIKDFKANTVTEGELVFVDAEGKVISDENAKLGTGMKVKVGKTLEYTLAVTGDVDGNAKLETNDIAKIKLHLLERTILTDEAQMQAAHVDEDDAITVNDIARLKLVLLNLFTIM